MKNKNVNKIRVIPAHPEDDYDDEYDYYDDDYDEYDVDYTPDDYSYRETLHKKRYFAQFCVV